MEELSNEALMLEYAKGKGRTKTKAFEVLYRRHKDSLYRFVRRQCRDPDITYDLVHEIWLKMIRGSRRYQPQAKFTTYLFTLARNRMVDYYRAQAARISTSELGPDQTDMEELPDPSQDDPEMRAHIRDLLERSLERIYILDKDAATNVSKPCRRPSAGGSDSPLRYRASSGSGIYLQFGPVIISSLVQHEMSLSGRGDSKVK